MKHNTYVDTKKHNMYVQNACSMKHEEEVNAIGGLFFPLIVETLGLWTPNSLWIIKRIASIIN